LGQNVGVAALLTRALLVVATLACAIFNGFGGQVPVFESVDQLLGTTLRGYPYMTRAVIYAYVTPVAITLMTLAIAGIPAALYERIRGLKWSTAVSLAIWLAATVLLALPAIMRAFETDELR
jgi:hypothetical protein